MGRKTGTNKTAGSGVSAEAESPRGKDLRANELLSEQIFSPGGRIVEINTRSGPDANIFRDWGRKNTVRTAARHKTVKTNVYYPLWQESCNIA